MARQLRRELAAKRPIGQATLIEDGPMMPARLGGVGTCGPPAEEEVVTPDAPTEANGSALFVVHYSAFGGPHNRVQRVEPLLKASGWHVRIALPTEPGNAAKRLTAAGIKVIQLPLGRLRRVRDPRAHLAFLASFPRQVLRLRHLIERLERPVVLVGTFSTPHAAIAAHLAGVPVIWHIVDSANPPLVRRAMMPLVRWLADAVVLGGASLETLHAGQRPLTMPTFIVSPPVDTCAFVPSEDRRRATREGWGIPLDAPLVGTVANISTMKGLEYFVDAAALIRESRRDAHFVIVGSAHKAQREYLRSLRDRARLRGLAERLQFVGDRPDVESVYPAFDVMMITSLPRSEGTTTTAMEAMACCVPVVATRVGAVDEVVEEGVTGYLVEPCRGDLLAERALEALKPGMHETLGERGRALVQERFDVRVCAERYRAAFAAAREHRARRGRV